MKGANVDSAENMDILVTMSKCLQRQAKECDIQAADLKAVLEDELLKELTIRYVSEIRDSDTPDFIRDIMLYHLCGYMLHSRANITECKECKKTVIGDELKLPPQFNADFYTALLNRGNLIFVTVEMFETFRVIEKIIQKHFEPIGQMYAEESFQTCISSISKAHLIPLFCDVHRDHILPYLIREFVQVRYHLESKRLKSHFLMKASANVKKNKKLAKLV